MFLSARTAMLSMLLFFLGAISLRAPVPAQALTSEELNTISIYEEVAASVVNINTALCEPDYFYCAVPASGSGSGIIIKEDGLIVTNYHVIEGSENIQVVLADGRRFKARVLGASPGDDIALIRVDPGDRPVKAIRFANGRSPSVGEKVLAIGNPFGLGQTLTVGTVSMVGRNIKSGGRILENLIQTDAPINPGNSGGALVDSRGGLVGMSTMILSPTGSSIGIGFAIPAEHIKKMSPGLTGSGIPWFRLALVALFLYWLFRRIYRLGS